MHSDRNQVSASLRSGIDGEMDCKGTQGNLGGEGNIFNYGGGFMANTCDKTHQSEPLK